MEKSKEITIEDILKKHWIESETFRGWDETIAAMQEWASLNRQGCRWTKASEEEGDITITRELVYGIIKAMCNYSNHYDNIAFKKIQTFGEYYYEDDEGFDIVLTKLTNAELETILLGFK